MQREEQAQASEYFICHLLYREFDRLVQAGFGKGVSGRGKGGIFSLPDRCTSIVGTACEAEPLSFDGCYKKPPTTM